MNKDIFKLIDLLAEHGMTYRQFEQLADRHGWPCFCVCSGEMAVRRADFQKWLHSVAKGAACRTCGK